MAKEIKKSCYKKKRGNEKWILRGFDWHCIVSFNCLLRVWWSAACIQSAKPEQQSWEKHSKASSSMKHTNEARASRQGKGSSIKDIHYMYGGISSTVQVDLSHTNLLVHLFWFSISNWFVEWFCKKWQIIPINSPFFCYEYDRSDHCWNQVSTNYPFSNLFFWSYKNIYKWTTPHLKESH